MKPFTADRGPPTYRYPICTQHGSTNLGDHPLWPCPLGVVKKIVRDSYWHHSTARGVVNVTCRGPSALLDPVGFMLIFSRDICSFVHCTYIYIYIYIYTYTHHRTCYIWYSRYILSYYHMQYLHSVHILHILVCTSTLYIYDYIYYVCVRYVYCAAIKSVQSRLKHGLCHEKHRQVGDQLLKLFEGQKVKKIFSGSPVFGDSLWWGCAAKWIINS